MTEQYDEDLSNLTDPTPSELSEESSMEAAVDDDEDADPDAPDTEAEDQGPSTDDILETERPHAEDEEAAEVGLTDELTEDDSAAAEQGNRDGDEMVSEGEDPEEVSELGGDTEDIDAIGGIDEDEERPAPGGDLG
ncbi:hypothetical protein DEO23_01560 [Brachybacterium endophyticum]|uniref:Uncharacterized protein n=1 Tax=Brachybacterium endophyticum TaxID=2182385 RepID=A0A2U2RNA7_9MICO|nr:hypothetical protein [Brachybacterium endophyticum]PWH07359.1 hypothetical protein DEO23_01560 [Brachybacterium endophyticum]